MKTSLTEYEQKLVTDADILITKNIIIQKVYELFGKLAEDYQVIIRDTALTASSELHAKISRGENYRGLPYVILDFPRNFGKKDVFAIRSFFWWGNFFSITLQLEGQFYSKYAKQVEEAINRNQLEEWWLGCSENRWEHHFESGNYQLISDGIRDKLSSIPHLKIAKKIPLDKWDDVYVFFKENFTYLIQLLTHQAPIL
jgi:hypothetical protein